MTLHQLFEEQSFICGSEIAIQSHNETLTYLELRKQSNRYAHYLISKQKVKPGQVVAVFMERSLELYIAILAILKAGGTYLPLDPESPKERNNQMLKDLDFPLVITSQSLSSALGSKSKMITFSLVGVEFEQTLPKVNLSEHSLAYIIYTSGSTGAPKGCQISHKSIVNFIKWSNRHFSKKTNRSTIQKFSYTFDFSVFEIFWPLTSEMTLHLAKPGGQRDLSYLIELIMNHEITTLMLVPSVLKLLMEERNISSCQSLNEILVGGEALTKSTVDLIHRKLPKIKITNLYGPTETTVFSTYYEIKKNNKHNQIPIGVPIPGNSIYILDSSKKKVPKGQKGEIYIGGVQVSNGYWRRTDLNNEKFIRSKVYKKSKLYRTGDSGYMLKNGLLVYEGRVDSQVKVRGYRVELGEIESQLLKNQKINQAGVVYLDEAELMVAFVCAKSNLSAEELTKHLSEKLPHYMIPNVYCFVSEIPQMLSGKIDRNELKKIALQKVSKTETSVRAINLEEELVQIWKSILKNEKIDYGVAFQAQGGDSLGFIRMLQRIKKLGFDVTLEDIFKNSKFKEQLSFLKSRITLKNSTLFSDNNLNEYKASSLQERLYFLYKLNPSNCGSNDYTMFRFKGSLQIKKLRVAINSVVNNNRILRTNFFEKNNAVFQKVKPQVSFNCGFTDLSHKGNKECLVRKKTDLISKRPYLLESEPLYRFHIFKMSKNTHLLFMGFHHSITDATTTQLLCEQVCNQYFDKDSSEEHNNYFEYVNYEKNKIDKLNEKTKSYWASTLKNCSEEMSLPFDKPRTNKMSSEYKYKKIKLSQKEYFKLTDLAKRLNVSKASLAASIFAILLHRYTADEDINIGTSVDMRHDDRFKATTGPIINNVVIRTKVNFEDSYNFFLQKFNHAWSGAVSNADLPFEDLLKIVRPNRALHISPLYQVMFQYVNVDSKSYQDFELTAELGDDGAQDIDLSARCTESDDNCSLELKMNLNLFEEHTLEQWATSFYFILRQILSNQHIKIKDIELIDKVTLKKMTMMFTGKVKKYESCRGIHEYFENQVNRTPHRTALEFLEESLTYEKLEKKSNQVAHYLLSQNVKKNDFVPIIMDRSFEMIISIYGVLKSGAAFVPLDPALPLVRTQYILNDIKPKVVLTQQNSNLNYSLAKSFVFVDSEWDQKFKNQSEIRLKNMCEPNSAAYMIYTSGSAGGPKGCVIEHKGIANHLQWFKKTFNLSTQDRFLFRTPFSFDASVWEYIWPLMVGAKVVVCPPLKHRDAQTQVNIILDKSITAVQFVPSFLSIFLDEPQLARCKSLKYVFTGGEAISVELVKRFYEILPKSQLIDTYGPTETTVACTYWKWKKTDKTPTIGVPTPNNRIFILDPYNNPMPFGAWGEICISGVQVCREYWKQPQLTELKFTQTPLPMPNYSRMYRTGDIGRFLKNGTIEYKGRNDNQIKIRGFRVELGEIENTILENEEINQVALVVKQVMHSGPLVLVAYLVLKNKFLNIKDIEAEIKLFLKSKLPDHMVPAHFFNLEEMPRTISGKVDRNKLLLLKNEVDPEATSEEPLTITEEKVATTWADVLKISILSKGSNYFSLGGDSLSLIRILRKLQDLFPQLQLEHLYQYQTVSSLSHFIDNSNVSDVHRVAKISNLEKKLYACSNQQAGYWKGLNSRGFNNFGYIINSLVGVLDERLLNDSLFDLVSQNWSLRTKIKMTNAVLAQEISSVPKQLISIINLSDVEDSVAEANLIENINNFNILNIDVAQNLPFQCCLIKMSEAQHFFYFKVDHIVFDATSMQLFKTELASRYNAKIGKSVYVDNNNKFQFVDYAEWEQGLNNQDPKIKKKILFWKSFLKELPSLALPIKKKQTDKIKKIRTNLGAGNIRQIEKHAKQSKTSVYTVIMTIFSQTLELWTGQRDIVFNTNVSIRPPEFESVMGCFFNYLPMRVKFSKFESLIQKINKLNQINIELFSNLIPTELFHKEVSNKDINAINNIITSFNFVSGNKDPIDLEGIEAENVELDMGDADWGGALFFQFSSSKSESNFSVHYKESMLTESSINNFIKIFLKNINLLK